MTRQEYIKRNFKKCCNVYPQHSSSVKNLIETIEIKCPICGNAIWGHTIDTCELGWNPNVNEVEG